jgi:hypothetical protein
MILQKESTMASATLKLTRGAVEMQRRPFEILLDGKVVGSVSRRETVELPVEPGRHTLRLHLGRRVSPERSFDAAEGELISFSSHGARVWPIYAASLIKPDLGISLKQE